ncbi:MAG: DUF4249 domain-containing protein [Chitinophagaceae bacterium]|nr:DUF4249 domain-containing protein [Chitinophagaceae bacterium]
MQNCIYALLALTVFTMSSCEKVIDINLNNASKKYVIEGMLSDQSGSCKVLITTTRNFDEDNSFVGISGAQVTIADGTGPELSLVESSNGIYENKSITGIVGHTYNLKVIINGEQFTASSTIPEKVLFDTLFVNDEVIFGELIKLVNLRYPDPVGRGNSYRFIQYINGEKDKTIFIRNDDLNDGRIIETVLFSLNDDDDEEESKISKGDEVRIEMLCVDAAVYKYWFSLDQSALGTNESASPANPVTNITGGALGYFSAHTYQTDSLISP